jgi:putative peptidoglycan lipid II flippase
LNDRVDPARPGRALAVASIIMMGSVVLSRVLGLVREMVIADIGGTGGQVSAYKAAFLLPDILNHILAGGFLSVTFIPIYARYLANGREAEGERVASLVLTVSAGLGVLLTVVGWVLAPWLVPLVVPGLDPELKNEVVRLTRIILPAQIFFIPGGVLIAVQMARGRFFIPALAPLVYNAGIILGGVALARGLGMAGFSWGVLGGAFAGNLLLQLWGANRAGFRFRSDFKWRHPDLLEYVLLTVPLALALTMTFSTEFFFKYFGSQVSAGAIASLDYALRLMMVLVAVFGQAAGTASYPFLARQAAEGRFAALNELLDRTLRRFLVPVIGAAVLVAVIAPEIVRLVYQRGRFDADSAAATTVALRGFLLGAPAWAASAIVVRGWFALRNTLVPALISTLGVGMALPLYGLFMSWWGTLGVALGASAAMWLQASLIYGLWCVKSSNAGAKGVVATLLRALGLSALLGAVAALARGALVAWLGAENFVGALTVVIVLTLAYSAAAWYLAPVFGLQELNGVVKRLLRRPPREPERSRSSESL